MGASGVAMGAVECRDALYEGARYTLCEVDAQRDSLRLFLRDSGGRIFGQFTNIARDLPPPRRLVFAMNAGMYHGDRSPVGLYIEDGQQAQPLITMAGPGNFGMLPNGVFCIRPQRADVIETTAFIRQRPDCLHATQSGPMLVIKGALHPRFLPNSPSRFIRNGVGTDDTGRRVIFAISNQPVTLHAFARLFRDHLNLPSALYLDGKVSRLYAPAVGRSDLGPRLGPIVGLVR
ncbi:MAG: phosphodiester glycosidase family protein [Rhodobacteraceae bacterium]|nr:phosphodiester glycosidase family protein [Paracoccaceae bacterium]